jgi:hypothetical protein
LKTPSRSLALGSSIPKQKTKTKNKKGKGKKEEAETQGYLQNQELNKTGIYTCLIPAKKNLAKVLNKVMCTFVGSAFVFYYTFCHEWKIAILHSGTGR